MSPGYLVLVVVGALALGGVVFLVIARLPRKAAIGLPANGPMIDESATSEAEVKLVRDELREHERAEAERQEPPSS